MSLKKAIVANYVSQTYTTLIGLVMLPVYIRYMGAEAYGLVGFFAMANALFMLLDGGLTPTLSREAARFQGGATDISSLRGLIRGLEVVFLILTAVSIPLVVLSSTYIAARWLKVEHLPLEQVRVAVVLMGVTFPVRWMSGLYRGAINGFERQVWLAIFNVLIATMRFGGVIVIFVMVGSTPINFFSYQLLVALVELAGLSAMTYAILPRSSSAGVGCGRWAALRSVAGFSLTIAFTSIVWILITQTDKLFLSRMLPLSEYGYFSLAIVVASAVNLMGVPVAQATLPRITRLSAEGNEAGVISVYRNATQLVCVMALPAAMTLAAGAHGVLWAWTGNTEVVARAAPIVILYALGNGILAMGSQSYALQYAKGDLRMHVAGNVLLLVFLVPAQAIAARLWGAMGTGAIWLSAMALYFVIWVPIIHRRMIPGRHVKWLLQDVMPILAATLAVGWIVSVWLPRPESRVGAFVSVTAAGLLTAAAATIGSSMGRQAIRLAWKRL